MVWCDVFSVGPLHHDPSPYLVTLGPPSPSPAPSPAPANDDAEKIHDQEVKNKIHKEYLAALAHEGMHI